MLLDLQVSPSLSAPRARNIPSKCLILHVSSILYGSMRRGLRKTCVKGMKRLANKRRDHHLLSIIITIVASAQCVILVPCEHESVFAISFTVSDKTYSNDGLLMGSDLWQVVFGRLLAHTAPCSEVATIIRHTPRTTRHFFQPSSILSMSQSLYTFGSGNYCTWYSRYPKTMLVKTSQKTRRTTCIIQQEFKKYEVRDGRIYREMQGKQIIKKNM